MKEENIEFYNMVFKSMVPEMLLTDFGIRFINSSFHRTKENFKYHPMNVYHSGLLKSKSNELYLQFADLIKDEIKRFTNNPFPKDKVMAHRDMICHPYCFKWRNPKRQKFYDDGNDYCPARIGIVISCVCILNPELEKINKEKIKIDFEITHMFNDVIYYILSRSMKNIITKEDLYNILCKRKKDFIKLMYKYTDGTNPNFTDTK